MVCDLTQSAQVTEASDLKDPQADVTFRLVAQCLNQLRHCVPHYRNTAPEN